MAPSLETTWSAGAHRIRHYSTVRMKGTLRKIEQRTKTWLVKNTQGDSSSRDKDLAGQKHSWRSSSGQRLGWSKTLREIEQRTKTWLVKNIQGDRAADKDLDWSKTLREIEQRTKTWLVNLNIKKQPPTQYSASPTKK